MAIRRGPQGYDFFADVNETRSGLQTLDTLLRFGTPLNALERLEKTVEQLPGRLQLLYERGLAHRTRLAATVAEQVARLRSVAQESRAQVERAQQRYRPEVEALTALVAENDTKIEADGYDAHAEAIHEARETMLGLRERITEREEAVLAHFREVANAVRALERRVRQLEVAAELLGRATFPLQPGEALVLAQEGRAYLGREPLASGVLYLTTMRFLFEQREEVERRPRFLPFGRKQRVDELILALPVAQVGEGQLAPAPLDSLSTPCLHLPFTAGRGVPAEGFFELAGQEAHWQALIAGLQQGDFEAAIQEGE